MKGMASEEGSLKKDKMWRERVNECGSKILAQIIGFGNFSNPVSQS
jgi:hypothetical protein